MNFDVLIVSPTFNFGGAEKVSVNIANLLYLNNIKVVLVVLDDSGPLRALLNPNIPVLVTNNASARKAIGSIKKIIGEKKPKAVFSNTSRLNFAVLIAKLFNVSPNTKFVCREPNNPHKTHQNTNFILKSIYRFLYKNADFIIAQNGQMNSDIICFYKVEEEKVKTLHNPVSINLSDKVDTIRDNYFIFVGRFTEQKNIPALLEAFKIAVNRNNISTKLYLFGSGILETFITDFIHSNNLSEKVFVFQPIIDVHDYIANARALILPSNWEGSPNVVLESLKCGTPSIVSPILSQYEDLIDRNAYGYVIDSKPDEPEFINELASLIIEFDTNKKEFFEWSCSTDAEYLAFFKSLNG